MNDVCLGSKMKLTSSQQLVWPSLSNVLMPINRWDVFPDSISLPHTSTEKWWQKDVNVYETYGENHSVILGLRATLRFHTKQFQYLTFAGFCSYTTPACWWASFFWRFPLCTQLSLENSLQGIGLRFWGFFISPSFGSEGPGPDGRPLCRRPAVFLELLVFHI